MEKKQQGEQQIQCLNCNGFDMKFISFTKINNNNTEIKLMCVGCGKLQVFETAGAFNEGIKSKDISYAG